VASGLARTQCVGELAQARVGRNEDMPSDFACTCDRHVSSRHVVVPLVSLNFHVHNILIRLTSVIADLAEEIAILAHE